MSSECGLRRPVSVLLFQICLLSMFNWGRRFKAIVSNLSLIGAWNCARSMGEQSPGCFRRANEKEAE